MSDDLRDDLTAISGVGEATADKIEAVLDEHATTDTDGVRADLGEALGYFEAGHPGYAESFVQDAYDALE